MDDRRHEPTGAGPGGEAPDQPLRERDLYRRLLDLAQKDEIDQLIEEALGLMVEVVGAEQGYLEIHGGDDVDLSWSADLGCSEQQVEAIRKKISRGIIAEAVASGELLSTQSALLDDRFSAMESVQRERIEAVLCSPIGRDRGVVYLQGGPESGLFSAESEEHVQLFARVLAPYCERLLARQLQQASRDAIRPLRERFRLDGVVGQSPALARALEEAMLAAPLDVNVLLTGAPGTGKTQLAHLIHGNSRRASGPLVELNCAALPDTLLESELFGAKAGSHSEARRDVPGKIAAADGGTLFLDEIGELSLPAQAKLLQFLHSKQYFPLGATQPRVANVRVIAATNAPLDRAVAEKRFREDLYFRLHVLHVRVPSLAERSADLRPLAEAFCAQAVARHSLPERTLSAGALAAIAAAEWPGNIRQLENAVEAAVIRSSANESRQVEARHLFPDEEPRAQTAEQSYQAATRRFQRELLARTLEEEGWNVSATARRLELARSYVYELIGAFDLSRDSD